MSSFIPDQLTVVEHVYHQPAGEQPTGIETRFSRHLKTQEQPYCRRLLIGEDWVALDHGWVNEASHMVVQNMEGRFTQVNPTDEQCKEVAARVIELGYQNAKGYWLIGPGESLRGQPNVLDGLMLRCQQGKAQVTINVFPA